MREGTTPIGNALSAFVLAFRQAPKGRKWSLLAFVILRRLENRTGLAWIRIKAKDQELSRQCAQIDRAAHKWLGIVPFDAMLLAVRLTRFGKLLRRLESDIDRLFDLVRQWLQRDDAILAHGGGNGSTHMQAAATPGDVETRLKPWQIP